MAGLEPRPAGTDAKPPSHTPAIPATAKVHQSFMLSSSLNNPINIDYGKLVPWRKLGYKSPDVIYTCAQRMRQIFVGDR